MAKTKTTKRRLATAPTISRSANPDNLILDYAAMGIPFCNADQYLVYRESLIALRARRLEGKKTQNLILKSSAGKTVAYIRDIEVKRSITSFTIELLQRIKSHDVSNDQTESDRMRSLDGKQYICVASIFGNSSIGKTGNRDAWLNLSTGITSVSTGQNVLPSSRSWLDLLNEPFKIMMQVLGLADTRVMDSYLSRLEEGKATLHKIQFAGYRETPSIDRTLGTQSILNATSGVTSRELNSVYSGAELQGYKHLDFRSVETLTANRATILSDVTNNLGLRSGYSLETKNVKTVEYDKELHLIDKGMPYVSTYDNIPENCLRFDITLAGAGIKTLIIDALEEQSLAQFPTPLDKGQKANRKRSNEEKKLIGCEFRKGYAKDGEDEFARTTNTNVVTSVRNTLRAIELLKCTWRSADGNYQGGFNTWLMSYAFNREVDILTPWKIIVANTPICSQLVNSIRSRIKVLEEKTGSKKAVLKNKNKTRRLKRAITLFSDSANNVTMLRALSLAKFSNRDVKALEASIRLETGLSLNVSMSYESLIKKSFTAVSDSEAVYNKMMGTKRVPKNVRKKMLRDGQSVLSVNRVKIKAEINNYMEGFITEGLITDIPTCETTYETVKPAKGYVEVSAVIDAIDQDLYQTESDYSVYKARIPNPFAGPIPMPYTRSKLVEIPKRKSVKIKGKKTLTRKVLRVKLVLPPNYKPN